MQIRITRHSTCAAISIPPGDYLVALSSENHQIRLTGHGLDLMLPATRRRSKARGRMDSVALYPGGGGSWSLVIHSPKLGEWIALIEEDRTVKA
ncbi:MAG: hypothetical protein ACK5QT_04885 [Oligoflexia bacterium]